LLNYNQNTLILVGYYSKKQSIIDELSNKGELNNIKLIKIIVKNYNKPDTGGNL